MVFEPLQLFYAGTVLLAVLAVMRPTWLVIYGAALFSYVVGAGVGLSLAVGPKIVLRALFSKRTLGWPVNDGPVLCIGIPLGLVVFVALTGLLFREPGEAPRAHA